MQAIDQLLAAARARIRRLTPEEALAAAGRGAVLVDIRPSEQCRRDGLVPGAWLVGRNVLEWRLDPACAHRIPELARRDHLVLLVCDEGYQSSLAAATLCDLGLQAGDVIGGVQRWKEEGLPLEAALPGDTASVSASLPGDTASASSPLNGDALPQ